MWWLRVHMARTYGAVLLATFAVAPLLAGSALPIPSLLGGLGSGIPVPLALPVVPACVLLHALSRAPWEPDAVAVRPVAAYRTAVVVGTALVALVFGLIEMRWLDFDLAPGVARNLVGYIGVGLIVQYFFGARFGPLAVALVPVGCALVGLGPGQRPYPWAWPLHESTSALSAIVAFCIFAIAACLSTKAAGEKRCGGQSDI
jgi:hypothetical protein